MHFTTQRLIRYTIQARRSIIRNVVCLLGLGKEKQFYPSELSYIISIEKDVKGVLRVGTHYGQGTFNG